MRKESRSYLAVPPGATLREQLENRRMTQKELSLRMGISEKHISRLISGLVMLTPDMAYKLEMVLGIPARFWNNLETAYREKLVKVQHENAMEAEKRLALSFPYEQMSQLGWVPVTENPAEQVENLRKYFEVASLAYIESTLPPYICTDAKNRQEERILSVWAQRLKLLSRKADPASFSVERLSAMVPILRSRTREPVAKIFNRAAEEMVQSGVVLLALPETTPSDIFGMTVSIGGQYVIALSPQGNADQFWHSLYHEIGHILLKHFERSDLSVSGREREARDYSDELLIPMAAYMRFTEEEEISKTSIQKFSEELGIHPGIVVGRLQRDGKIPLKAFEEMKDVYRLSSAEN